MTSTTPAFLSSVPTSFCPFPMSSDYSISASRSFFPTRTSSRGPEPLVLPQSMDPQSTDPNVLFIHPPFTFFPNSHSSPDGLTYNLLAENPDWFLDPNDFVSTNTTNPNAIPYPPYLEPPRGWCPAKKKDLKERGAEGWPEGEEPRLRCTFCRRTYAGVNAKSMWRRHVFEKHKIAMSNRRDGNPDRPRGRGSGKENKHVVSVKHSNSHDGLVSIVVTPQTAPDTSTHKSRFRSEKTGEKGHQRTQIREGSMPLTPRRAKNPSTSSEGESDSDAQPQTITPPLTPSIEDFTNVFGSSETALTSPVLSCPPPESPYNPLQTPAFRHSSRLPYRQPWRFPSPSHPLHSKKRELSLTVLTRLQGTPSVKDELTTANPSQSSPLLTIVDSNTATPSSSFRASRKRPHLFNQMSSPSSVEIKRQPLATSPGRRTKAHRRHPSDSSEFWCSDEHLSKAPIDPTLADSYAIYEFWPTSNAITMTSPLRPCKRFVELESPIVRCGPMGSLPVDLLGSYESMPAMEDVEDVDDDLKEILLSSPLLRDDRWGKQRQEMNGADCSPPLKKRKLITPGPSSILQ